jgi:hypothetical protein
MTILVLRLSSLRDTAASSTHRLLADLALSALPDAGIDFAFLPPKRAPLVSGVFTGRPLAAFDLVLATNAFVQEAVNLPWLLHANGIAPWASERTDATPPILLGGSNAFASQCLVRPDGTAVPDALFFGEAEESLPRFLARWQAGGTGVPRKRARLLAAAAALDGFWVTGAPPSASARQAVARTPPPPTARQPLPDTDTAGTVRLTVGLGCAAFCAFCFEGYERKPYRERPVAELLGHARALKQTCGARTVELDAFNLNHYAQLGRLVEGCSRLFDRISFKSQRADGIAACPAIVDLERAAGKSAFTLGIEGISARQRAFLAKSLTDAEIAAAIQTLLDRRVRELKLFFILTGHETPEDLAAFGDFCLRLKGWLAQPKACTRTVLSFGRLVRMPNTPLAFDRLLLDDAAWRFAVDGAAAVCRRAQLECRFAFDYPDYLGTQLLAACRHDHAEAVVALACDGLSYHGPWSAAEAARLRTAIPLGDADTVADADNFPFVRRAVAGAFLRQRWTEAEQALDGGYCLGRTCLGCAACADAEERRTLTDRPRTPPVTADLIATVARIEADKRRLPPRYLRVTLPDGYSNHSPGWVAASLMRLLLAEHPGWTDALLSVEEALFSAGGSAECLVIPAGETVIALRAWQMPPSLPASSLGMRPLETPAFTPGAFTRAVWSLHTRLAPREAAQRAGEWLKQQHLPFTLRRHGGGTAAARCSRSGAPPPEPPEAWHLDLAPAALKKRAVFSLAAWPAGDGTRLDVAFSPKARLRELAAHLPPCGGQPHLLCREVSV